MKGAKDMAKSFSLVADKSNNIKAFIFSTDSNAVDEILAIYQEKRKESNERLINQLFQISLRCGLSPHMYNPYTSTLATTPGYTIVYNHIDKDFINLVNKNINKINFLSKIQLNNRFWYNDEYYMEIKNIKTEDFDGVVYNFEVENTHLCSK